jgi:hypothetical protein
MVNTTGWTPRNKDNEFFATNEHVKLAKNQKTKGLVDSLINPARLFRAGEQGVWFEPSPTTCFTDTARTTPATVGQAVAGMTDLSGRGNHATQDITSARPILARVPASGRRNLLTRTEEFDISPWLRLRVNVADNATIAPNGTSTAARFTCLDTGVPNFSQESPKQVLANQNTTWSAFIKKDDNPQVLISLGDSAGGGNRVEASFDLDTGTVINARPQGSGYTLTGSGIEDVGNGWFRVFVSGFKSTATTTMGGRFRTGNSLGANGDNTSAFIWGAQLEQASEPSAYQRVGSTFDVTEAGQPDNWFLSFDGVDDFMQTPSIDFTGTDKMSVFAGVRKLSDGVASNIVTTGSAFAQSGRFELRSSRDATPTYALFYSGTTWPGITNLPQVTGFPAPHTGIVTGFANISTSLPAFLRVNSVQSNATGSGGIGNFANEPLSIGSRGGTSLFFNGHIYSLIVRGALTDEATIERTEKYVANRTAGVTL